MGANQELLAELEKPDPSLVLPEYDSPGKFPWVIAKSLLLILPENDKPCSHPPVLEQIISGP